MWEKQKYVENNMKLVPHRRIKGEDVRGGLLLQMLCYLCLQSLSDLSIEATSDGNATFFVMEKSLALEGETSVMGRSLVLIPEGPEPLMCAFIARYIVSYQRDDLTFK